MDYGRRNPGCASNVFRTFVCVALTMLLGIHVFTYFGGSGYNSIDGDFSDIKYVVMQLSRSLTDSQLGYWRPTSVSPELHVYMGGSSYYQVNRKHEILQVEMERLSSVLPQVTSGHSKSKEALEPCRRNNLHNQIGEVLDYDRQITDFALESAGARVIDTADTIEHVQYESPVGYALHIFTSWVCRNCLGARAMIRPSSLPGECWAFKGSRGEATILLLGTVKITGFSIEHIPAQISPTREISSAPRLYQVEGLEYRTDAYGHDYGTFEYDKDGKPNQYFEVAHPTNKGFNIVRLRVLSNWGHPVHTCVYRFRVHGELVHVQVPKNSGEDNILEVIENE